jgi:aldose 1-epimerase
MQFSTRSFGKTLSGEEATLFRVQTSGGMEVDFSNYGARIVALRVPQKEGNLADIVLGYDSVIGYDTGKRYFGSNPGPFANRIKGAGYTIDGCYYPLEANEGENQLHGGKIGFDKRFWVPENTASGIRFKTTIPHGEAGRPGNLQCTIEYILQEDHTLQILFMAETDRPTHVNITHHGYFNLNGNGDIPVLNHILQLNAAHVLQVDSAKIPTGERMDVENTPFDFRRPAAVGDRIALLHEDFDHCFVLSQQEEIQAVVHAPYSGIEMTLQTDYPGMQFYCSGKAAGSIAGKGGVIYPPYSSLCLEPQYFPDAPNRPEFPSTLLRPGEIYKKQITLTFSLK